MKLRFFLHDTVIHTFTVFCHCTCVYIVWQTAHTQIPKLILELFQIKTQFRNGMLGRANSDNSKGTELGKSVYP